MSVNIWASIIHLSDSDFSGAGNKNSAGLDLLISEKLYKRITYHEQTWMINPVWRSPGTTAVLLRDSYRDLRDGEESYLVLVTPGFADISSGVSAELVGRQLNQIGQDARVFNKKIITTLLGVPKNSPPKIAGLIRSVNKITKSVTQKHGGLVADLQNLRFSSWTDNGSRPENLEQVADAIVDKILECHPSFKAWEKLHK